MLRNSEHMLWIQSMLRVPYVYWQMPIGSNWLVIPIIVYVHMHWGLFKVRGVKKDSIPDVIKLELTNIPVNSGIFHPDIDYLLYGHSHVIF